MGPTGTESPVSARNLQAEQGSKSWPTSHRLEDSPDALWTSMVIVWTAICSVLTIYDLYLLGMVLLQSAAIVPL